MSGASASDGFDVNMVLGQIAIESEGDYASITKVLADAKQLLNISRRAHNRPEDCDDLRSSMDVLLSSLIQSLPAVMGEPGVSRPILLHV